MPQSLAAVLIHIVFSTKDRRPFLADPAFRLKTHSYITGICAKQDSPCLQIGGMPDHLHLLCALSRTVAMADLLREIKRSSTNWIRENAPDLRDFAWQGGYGVFSVSAGNAEAVKRYIQNQEEHHRAESFQDELRRVLREPGIVYDERYLWD